MIEAYKRSAEAIILAGGHGKRMGPITETTQKCLLPIDEKPAMFHILDGMVEAFGSVDVKIGVAYKADQVKDAVDDYIQGKKISVTYVPHAEGSESGGAYRTLAPHINGDTIVISPGDVIAQAPAYRAAREMFDQFGGPFVATFSPKLDEIDSHGVGLVQGNQLVDYLYPPKGDLPTGSLRDMTIYGTNHGFFHFVEQYSQNGKTFLWAIKDILRDHQVPAQVYNGPWVHIGYPEDLRKTMQTMEIPVFDKNKITV